uniref:LRRCT domain-containing protein n=1 Tax=Branchiostoma floridae TaxID=7739 RepID=C3YGU5_BRAFL|eukprot:XP_002604405.1 hypothetical protein BRAFLDRAFT_79291 [Branchiostoma floridae]
MDIIIVKSEGRFKLKQQQQHYQGTKMGRRLRHVLIFLLIILKEPELPEAGCRCSISSPCVINRLRRTPETPCCNCDSLGLKSAPQNILKNITFLYLGNNQITSFPQNLPKSIIRLELRFNQITSIQTGALSKLPQLDILDVMYNRITNINPGIFSSHSLLREVILVSNRIKYLKNGAFSNLPKLEYLNLHRNMITSIQPGAFTNVHNLTSLYLDQNQITSIQTGIFTDLPKLIDLILGSNQIQSIQPGSFTNLQRLTDLELEKNQITSIQPGTFSNLPILKYLYLGKNKITSIQTGTFSTLPSLKCLFLNENQISFLPPSVHDMLSAIHSVSIEENPWQCDCGMVPFRLKMNGSASFENEMTCAQPDNFRGQKLKDINPEDLICNETTISTLPLDLRFESTTNCYNVTVTSPSRWYFKRNAGSTARSLNIKSTLTAPLAITPDTSHESSPSFPLPVLVGSICGTGGGIVLIGVIVLTIWCKRRTALPPSGQNSNVIVTDTNTTATVDIHDDQTAQGQSHAGLRKVGNLTHNDILAALKPNAMYAGVVTTPKNSTSTSGHDQTGQGQSHALSEPYIHTPVTVQVSGHRQAGQQAITGSLNNKPTYNTGSTAKLYKVTGPYQAIIRPHTNTTAAVNTVGQGHQYEDMDTQHDQTEQGQSQAITKSYANIAVTAVISGHDQTEQAQATTPSFDARNLAYNQGTFLSQPNRLYTGVGSPPNNPKKESTSPGKPVEENIPGSPNQIESPKDEPLPLPPSRESADTLLAVSEPCAYQILKSPKSTRTGIRQSAKKKALGQPDKPPKEEPDPLPPSRTVDDGLKADSEPHLYEDVDAPPKSPKPIGTGLRKFAKNKTIVTENKNITVKDEPPPPLPPPRKDTVTM